MFFDSKISECSAGGLILKKVLLMKIMAQKMITSFFQMAGWQLPLIQWKIIRMELLCFLIGAKQTFNYFSKV